MGKETRLTNNELCQIDYGLITFDALESGNLADVYNQMWLPDHSIELVNSLQEARAITLVGEVGSGKSALLYGARTVMRAQAIPYTYINGHFKDSPAEEVINVINEAEKKNVTLVYDSADYLAGGSKKVRALPLRTHIPRNLAIMERLLEYRNKGGTLLMTSHTEDWLKDFGHPDLLPTWESLQETTAKQEVKIHLPEYDQRITLLNKMGVNSSIAEYIAQLPDNPDFIDHIANKWGDKKYIKWAQDNLTKYQTLKLLAKDNYGHNEQVLKTINESFKVNTDPTESWDSVLDFIYSKTFVVTFFSKL